MQIFMGAVSLGFLIAILLSFVAVFLPNYLSKGLKQLLDFLESIPDVIIAVLLQALTIYAYKAWGVDLFRVAGYMDEKVLFAPIVALAILPAISLFKILLFRIDEEFLKDYAVFLKSKGIHKFGILSRHISKNVLVTILPHAKIIIWATLSSQFVIEYLFNVKGISFAIIDSFTPMTIAVALIMIFTPFFLFFQLMDMWLYDSPAHSEIVTFTSRKSFTSLISMKGWFNNLKYSNWKKVKPWKPVTNLLKIFGTHMKNIKFAIGSLFFIIVITISVTYSVTTDNHVDRRTIIYEEDGSTIKSTPPHPPGEPFFIGSDEHGYDFLDQLIIGAKYTLIFSLLIALLRVLTGLLGGILYVFTIKIKIQRFLENLVDSIHFLPLTLIAYILLRPILLGSIHGFDYSFTQRIILEIFILTILVIPLTTVAVGKDIKHVLQNEFIMSAMVLGGSRLHILRRHIFPHIGPRLAILFGQQFISVLYVLIHLGVLEYYFGGTIMVDDGPDQSVTNEWSGLLGGAKNELEGGDVQLWLLVFPLLAFVLSIFAMQFIIKGIKEIQQVKVGVLYKFQKKKFRNIKENVNVYEPAASDFEMIKRKNL
ncbi:ABC transporter permease subunit [Virgibacillus flavescens]|uniref:ABC transporter permease subunit n=1 Tax=Virgibacillus flavescens TaxID=1611422 RepID=UPI003D33D684